MKCLISIFTFILLSLNGICQTYFNEKVTLPTKVKFSTISIEDSLRIEKFYNIDSIEIATSFYLCSEDWLNESRCKNLHEGVVLENRIKEIIYFNLKKTKWVEKEYYCCSYQSKNSDIENRIIKEKYFKKGKLIKSIIPKYDNNFNSEHIDKVTKKSIYKARPKWKNVFYHPSTLWHYQ